MTQDDSLRAKARQNTLRTFLFYEAKLSAAYRQAAYARARRTHHDHSGRRTDPIQVDCE